MAELLFLEQEILLSIVPLLVSDVELQESLLPLEGIIRLLYLIFNENWFILILNFE